MSKNTDYIAINESYENQPNGEEDYRPGKSYTEFCFKE